MRYLCVVKEDKYTGVVYEATACDVRVVTEHHLNQDERLLFLYTRPLTEIPTEVELSHEFSWKELFDYERQELFKETDRYALPDYEHKPGMKEKWMEYRKILRHMSEMEGYPWAGASETIPWPEMPVYVEESD